MQYERFHLGPILRRHDRRDAIRVRVIEIVARIGRHRVNLQAAQALGLQVLNEMIECLTEREAYPHRIPRDSFKIRRRLLSQRGFELTWLHFRYYDGVAQPAGVRQNSTQFCVLRNLQGDSYQALLLSPLQQSLDGARPD